MVISLVKKEDSTEVDVLSFGKSVDKVAFELRSQGFMPYEYVRGQYSRKMERQSEPIAKRLLLSKEERRGGKGREGKMKGGEGRRGAGGR